MTVLVLADDLSGAAESAAALRLPGSRRTGPVRVVLGADPGSDRGDVVLDLDTRHLPTGQARARVAAALRAAGGRTVVAKVDSLLRGDVAGVLTTLAASGPVVFTPALPAAGRTVTGGRVLVDGAPLAGTSAWATEGRPAPESVAAAVGAAAGARLSLDDVRGPLLDGLLTAAVRPGTVVVVDAETDDDLDRLVAAATGPAARSAGVLLAGSAGLVAAFARAVPFGGPEGARHRDAAHQDIPHRPVLVVVGTAEPSAAVQVDHLLAPGAGAGVVVVDLPCEQVVAGVAHDLLARALVGGDVVVLRLTGRAAVPGRDLSGALARTVAAVAGAVDLVLTGGETARGVLDALGVRHLHHLGPVLRADGAVEHGAVVSATPDGRRVVTRPGSFGGPDSLRHMVSALRPAAAPDPVPVPHVREPPPSRKVVP